MSNVIRLILTGLMIVVASLGIASALGIETRAGDAVEITGDHTDMVFAAGGTVRLALSTPDDVYAAGGDIEASQVEADHLSLLGGKISISRVQVHDLVAGGGYVRLVDGTVADDVLIGAGRLILQDGLTIEGSAVVSGGDVVINSKIGGELKVAGEIVRLNSVVSGDVDISAGELYIGPQTRISGSLTHRTKSLDLSTEAVIEGETIALPPTGRQNFERMMRRSAVALALIGFLFVAGIIALMLASVAAFPGLMERSRAMLTEQPLSTLGIGFLIFIAAPVVIGLLFVTVLGIPLGLLIGVIYVALVPLAFAASVYMLGMRARQVFQTPQAAEYPGWGSRLLWTFLAALVLSVIFLIPFLGAVAWVLAYVFGLGAVASQAWLALATPPVHA